MYTETRTVQAHMETLGALKTERESFLTHWRDISEYMAPRQSRFLISDRNRSDKRSTKIWNETPIFAGRTLASGMMSGMSNPSQQWIRLTLSDPDLVKFQPVKMWLATARDRMLTVFLKSNLYTTLPLVYSDLGYHGTSAYLLMEDWEDLIRAYHMPIGSYMLACDE